MTTVDELVGLFPPGTRIDDDGTLVVGGCRLDEIAGEFGTPVLVVAEQAVRQRARDTGRASPRAGPTRRLSSPPRRSRAPRCSG